MSSNAPPQLEYLGLLQQTKSDVRNAAAGMDLGDQRGIGGADIGVTVRRYMREHPTAAVQTSSLIAVSIARLHAVPWPGEWFTGDPLDVATAIAYRDSWHRLVIHMHDSVNVYVAAELFEGAWALAGLVVWTAGMYLGSIEAHAQRYAATPAG